MKDINDILAKHFSGETTTEEANLVAEWKSQNEEEYVILSEAWQETDAQLLENLEFKTFDHKAAWNKIDNQLEDETVNETKPNKETKVIQMRFYRKVAAACAILMVGLAGFWFINRGAGMESVSNMANTPQEVTLPDGSEVWLAANSTLEYSKDFKNDRSLTLQGEAFFEVARDEAHPFVISTKYGEIEVLGTAFDVTVGSNETTVSVEHGKVALRNENGDVKLTAGLSASADETGVSTAVGNEENYDSWKTGVFEFEKTPLTEVVALLNKHYETQVKLDVTGADNKLFDGSFDNVDVKDIVESIELTHGLKVEHGEGVITLR